LPAADEVEVDVPDYLSAASLNIEQELVAFFGVQLFCQISGNIKHFGYYVPVLLGYVIDASDMFSWNNENMDGRFRSDIVKRHDILVRVDNLGRFLAVYDLTKQTVFVHLRLSFKQY
jgi:hypothetical protein